MPGVQATLASGDWLFRLRLTFSHASEHYSDSSNPTASTSVERCQTGRCKTPVFWRPARLEKRLDFRCATRNATPQAPCTEPAWAVQTAEAIGQECEKPCEKQGFSAERIGTQLKNVFPIFLEVRRVPENGLLNVVSRSEIQVGERSRNDWAIFSRARAREMA